jgi:alkanesulfonate monooxygenase SsuD/methylene tetrahydromethanopterin reductase-like flavin-dependent oxidoreductase (luciferase family)
MSGAVVDYGRPVQFGIFAYPVASSLQQTLRMIDAAERGGLDLVGIQDHPYQRRFVDTWMLMSAVLTRTSRIAVFPDVANLPLRLPAMMAKSAASLDVLSGGRFELGLGAGSFWDAVVAMGGPRRSPGESLAALSESIDVIRLMWSDERSVRYNGDHYRLSGVKPGPPPAHPISIWLGVYGPKALRLLGTKADGWVPSAGNQPRDELLEKHERIDAAAVAAGRNPAGIRRIYNIWGRLGGSPSGAFLQGPVEQWVDELTETVLVYGMDTFIFGPGTGIEPAPDAVEQVEVFAAEIAPAVRLAVANARGRP